jgi:hypothetical protein
MLFVYNTKKNPLEFAVSRGLVFIFSFGFLVLRYNKPPSVAYGNRISQSEKYSAT